MGHTCNRVDVLSDQVLDQMLQDDGTCIYISKALSVILNEIVIQSSKIKQFSEPSYTSYVEKA